MTSGITVSNFLFVMMARQTLHHFIQIIHITYLNKSTFPDGNYVRGNLFEHFIPLFFKLLTFWIQIEANIIYNLYRLIIFRRYILILISISAKKLNVRCGGLMSWQLADTVLQNYLPKNQKRHSLIWQLLTCNLVGNLFVGKLYNFEPKRGWTSFDLVFSWFIISFK